MQSTMGGCRVSLQPWAVSKSSRGRPGPGTRRAIERTAEEVRSLPLQLVDLSMSIAEEAAWLRGSDRLQMADAIHVASARAAGATALITNDRRIRARTGLAVLYLDDLALEHEPLS